MRISLKVVARGKPTVCMRWKAAVLDAPWRGCRTPPGSESGACSHRGHSGTWESHLPPCYSAGMGDRRTKSPGVTRGFHLATSPFGRPRTLEASRVSGNERQAKDSETGRVAVVAAHSTAEGGEVRPKRPTGGKAPSGRASAGRRQGRDLEVTNPAHGKPGDCGARWVLAWAADALPEEPYALIAHVRVCGGAGWVTTGSTRQPTRKKPRAADA
jgi:hypothetical protein